jgi:transcriptional regulator with XRE-family HTH domain
MTTFRLREARELSGLTVEQVAANMGMNPARVRRYESGERMPSWDKATDFAHALGCSLDELAGIEVPPRQTGEGKAP